jgi:hypothetical protein
MPQRLLMRVTLWRTGCVKGQLNSLMLQTPPKAKEVLQVWPALTQKWALEAIS